MKYYCMLSTTALGFEPTIANGNGIQNIRNRVAELKGNFELKTSAGKGCEVNITIPVSLNLGTK
jgi:two-component system, NarL family, sensor kinase